MGALIGPEDAYPGLAEDAYPGLAEDAYPGLAEDAYPGLADIERQKGMAMANICIGIDIGQKHDPTALCVAEPEQHEADGRTTTTYKVRHLERLPLGTAYPRVAKRLAEVVAGVRQKATAGRGITTYVDSTGVGQPIVDLLREAGVWATPVYFTYGDRRVVQEDRSVTLGKAYLVSRLVMLLQTERIQLPPTSEVDALVQELRDYDHKVEPDANEKYGAFKVGSHDDLVTALGLAVQEEPRRLTITWG